MTTAGTVPTPSTPEVGAVGPVLAVFAHPDDETLLAGGLLARLAGEGGDGGGGVRVVVVTATRGERGEMIGAPQLEGGPLVPELRPRELVTALGALGVREHHFLDELATPAEVGEGRWTDSGMAWVGPGYAGPAPDAPLSALTAGSLEAQAQALARLVRTLRPAVVISDEEGGSYGHPDHRRTHAIAVRALDLAAAPGPDLSGVVVDAVAPVHACVTVSEDRLRAANAEVAQRLALEEPVGTLAHPLLAPGPDLPALARPEEEVDLEVDTSASARRLLTALRGYPSQVQAATIPVLDSTLAPSRALARLDAAQAAVGWYALSNGVAQPILPTVGLSLVRGERAALRAGLGVAGDVRTAGAAAAPEVRPLVTPPSPGRIAAVVGSLALGLLLGVTTTVVHRWQLAHLPLGLVLALVTVTVGALAARALARGAGLLGYAVGVVAAVQAMAFVGVGGDVLVPGDTLGMVWLLGSVVALGVGAFLPDRWVGRGRTAVAPEG